MVANYTGESLAIEVGQSVKGEDVVQVLDAVIAERGTPQTIKVDNGSEFISKAMDRWAYEYGVELDFSRPGTPTDNAKVESFDGRFRLSAFLIGSRFGMSCRAIRLNFFLRGQVCIARHRFCRN